MPEQSGHLWLRDEDGQKYHATECWCWSDGRYEPGRVFSVGDRVLCNPSARRSDGHLSEREWHAATVESLAPVAGQRGIHVRFDYAVNKTMTAFATYDEVRHV